MKDYANAFGRGGLNDQLDPDRLVADIGLDAEEIAWRKEFLHFDEEDERRLASMADLFREHANQVADDFYDNLTQYDQTTAVIGRSEKSVEQLKQTQMAYLATLGSGEYGEEYFRNRARIGKIHDMLEMPMKHYLGQYGVYYDLLLPLLGDRLTENVTDAVVDRLASTGADPDDPADDARQDADDQVAGDGGVLATASADDGGAPVDRDDVREAVAAEVDDGIQDILAVLRLMNLDMQVVTDTYVHSYSQDLERALDDRESLMAQVEADLDGPISDLDDRTDEVSSSASALQDLADEQVTRVDQIANEVSNMSATVEEIASTADGVAETSEESEQYAQEGYESANEAVDVMDEVGAAVDDVTSDVDALQDRVGEIDEIVEVINDIADQTNILALNASIEAARAGEAGDGFAVVADEVKSLAEESQEHAGRIETMIEGIQADTADTVTNLTETTEQVDRGVAKVDEAMDHLETIVRKVSDATAGIKEVSEATDDQAASTEEVASMLDELVDRTDRVAEQIDAIAAANEHQSKMVADVNDRVQDLTSETNAHVE